MALLEELERQGNWLFRYRSILPTILIAPCLALFIYPLLCKQNIVSLQVLNFTLLQCFIISCIGLAIRVFTVGYTSENTSGRNTTEQVAASVNRTGIYSIIRHPLYVGNYFMWLGLAMIPNNYWFAIVFSLVFWLYYERIMFAEEQFLRGKFGNTYAEWADNVPLVIPNFKNYVKPNLPFSWRKVLKKEKDGLCATCFLLMLFQVLYQILVFHRIKDWMLIVIFAVVFVIYYILRILKYKTNLLNEEGR